MSISLHDQNGLFHDALVRIQSIRSKIEKCRRQAHRPEVLRDEVTTLPSDHPLLLTPEFHPLREQIERAGSTNSELLSEQDFQQMVESCDLLRVRMLAVGLGCLPSEFMDHLSAPSQDDWGMLMRERGGVVHSSIGNNIIILLPDSELVPDWERKVDSDLLSIWDDRQGRSSNWMLDFSSISSPVSLTLMGLLKAYMSDLQKTGHSLMISWLHDHVIEPRLYATICRSLKLTSIGGHLFSTNFLPSRDHANGEG